MPEVADILTYLVDESAKFHAALAGAVAKWSESGAVPPALLSSKKAKRAKSTRAKSGYSLFVADHIASLKKEGVTSLREKGKGKEEGKRGESGERDKRGEIGRTPPSPGPDLATHPHPPLFFPFPYHSPIN